jgi:hypothetical protein
MLAAFVGRVATGNPIGEDPAVALIVSERPLDQSQTPVAHRLLRPPVRGRHEPVQRQTDVEDHLAHYRLH